MDELDVDTYYGAYTRSVTTQATAPENCACLPWAISITARLVLKTDNRPTPVRAADLDKIEIATWGADYAHVFNTTDAGKFDFLVWGVVQTGSWGNLAQHAGAFVGEAGWQPPVKVLKPWVSAGYSYGSGDGNPNDTGHGTFFQDLPTPRQYARFPFYNMMNNEDLYATFNLRPVAKACAAQRSSYAATGRRNRLLVLRRRRVSAQDLWIYRPAQQWKPGTGQCLGPQRRLPVHAVVSVPLSTTAMPGARA